MKKHIDESKNEYNDIKPIKRLTNYKSKSHTYWACKCPKCYNFFSTRIDSVKSGHTKSCGCLKDEANENRVYHPMNCNHSVMFYDNCDDYFIYDNDKAEILEGCYWYANNVDKYGKGRRARATINGRSKFLSRLLLNTSECSQADHINLNPNDNRVCNLRNVTQQQNLYNRKTGQGKICQDEKTGKFKIRKFVFEDTSNLYFETESEAEQHLVDLRDKHMGEYSRMRSEEIASKYETHQFAINKAVFTGVLEEINSLPEKHMAKITLTNCIRDMKKADSEYQEYCVDRRLLKLIDDYTNGLFD